jgi:sporulation protein YlmC with PRC-barrel domain
MFSKSLAAGLAGSALLATVAFAQTPTATSDKPTVAATSESNAFQGDWRTSKVVGLSVYNDNNESVGSINDLLTDKSGNIKAAVISVGGVLGVGAHLVAVPFDKVKFVNEPVVFTTATGTSNTGAGGTPSTSTAPSATTTTGSAGPGTAASKPNPWYPDHAVYNATKDEMKAMLEFTYSAE